MTLTEFLLARIAEDEATAREVDPGVCVEGLTSVDANGGWLILSVHPTRVLAECAAKRRIVEELEALFEDSLRDPWEIEHALNVVYPLLALPYADHPDFQEVWDRE